MNPRARELVKALDDIKAKYGPEDVWRPTQQTALMAELMVLLAEEQEKSSQILVRQTGWLIRLTWAIAILTAGLLFFSGICRFRGIIHD